MSSAKKRRDLNRAIEEHKTVKLSAQFATSKHTMLNIAESVLAKENESLRTQVAAQAAVIEMFRGVLTNMQRAGRKQGWQQSYESEMDACAEALSITPSQALAAFATKVRNEAYEKAAVFCDLQQDEPECPERASYCAEAIRNLKKLP